MKMNKLVLAVVLAVSVTAAHASDNDDGNNGNNGNNNGPSSQASALVSGSGNSSSSAGVVGSGNSANIIKNDLNVIHNNDIKTTVKTDVKTSATAMQLQSQGQKQAVGINIVGDTYEAPEIPVSSAYAGPAISTAPCRVALSAGLSLMNIGGTFGGSVLDDQCDMRANAAAFAAIGMPVTAKDMLCQLNSSKNLPKCQESIKAVNALKAQSGGEDKSAQQSAAKMLGNN